MSSQKHQPPVWDSSSDFYDPLANYYDALRDIIGLPPPRFYQDLITKRTWSILELGCGTGVITRALADQLLEQHGSLDKVRVVGIDASAEMLRIARGSDNRVEWIQGDMRDPPLEGRFDLIVCCYYTLQYMLTDEDVSGVFNSARSLLQPYGVFAFDIYQPNFDYLKDPRTNQTIRSSVDAEGRILELREDARYDGAARVLRLDWRLIRQEPQGPTVVARARQYVAQYTAGDIDRLLRGAGLRMLARFGDMDRSSFTPLSKRQVVVCGPCAKV
jgi:SAM-dependent methyltransferase